MSKKTTTMSKFNDEFTWDNAPNPQLWPAARNAVMQYAHSYEEAVNFFHMLGIAE